MESPWFTFVGVFGCLAFIVFLSCDRIRKGYKIPAKIENIIISLLSLFYILFIGLRDSSMGTDTARYVSYFEYVLHIDSLTEYINGVRDAGIGFFLIAKIATFFSANPQLYLLVLACFYILLCVRFVYEISHRNRLLLLFAFIACFFFYSMGVNVLKSGIALMFILNGVSADIKQKRIKWLFFTMGFLVHATSILFIAAWFVLKWLKKFKLKTAYSVWGISVVLSAAGFGLKAILNAINISFIQAFITDYGYSSYVEGSNTSYTVGFRLDFTVFSLAFIVFGVWMYKKIKDETYRRLLCCYILLNAFFVLAYDVPYSDRIGLISWVLIPVILCYPFVQHKIAYNRKIFSWYAFTLGVGIFSFILTYPY